MRLRNKVLAFSATFLAALPVIGQLWHGVMHWFVPGCP